MTTPHRPLSLLAPALLALALGACATPPDTATAAETAAADPGDAASQCNAAAAQSFVGREANDTTVAEAQAAAGATGSVRVIKPGQAVTMDFRGDRLNIHVDAQGAIERIDCG